MGFSIIVSEEILKKLFSDKNQACVCDKMEILNNVLAMILFAAVGIIRIIKYNSILIKKIPELSDSGEMCIIVSTTTYPNGFLGLRIYLAVGVLAIIIGFVFLVEHLWGVCKLSTGDSVE